MDAEYGHSYRHRPAKAAWMRASGGSGRCKWAFVALLAFAAVAWLSLYRDAEPLYGATTLLGMLIFSFSVGRCARTRG